MPPVTAEYDNMHVYWDKDRSPMKQPCKTTAWLNCTCNGCGLQSGSSFTHDSLRCGSEQAVFYILYLPWFSQTRLFQSLSTFSFSLKWEPNPLTLKISLWGVLHFPLLWCSPRSSLFFFLRPCSFYFLLSISFCPYLPLSHSVFPKHDLISSSSQRRHLGFGSRARDGMTPLLEGEGV